MTVDMTNPTRCPGRIRGSLRLNKLDSLTPPNIYYDNGAVIYFDWNERTRQECCCKNANLRTVSPRLIENAA